MNLTQMVAKTQHYTKKNASTILSCLGALGVVGTTLSAIKATPKAIEVLEERDNQSLTTFEKALVVAPVYFPTILFGTATVTCIFGANMLNKKKQATLVSAYAYLNSSFNEYKDKVKAIYGEDGEKRVRDELAKDKYIQQSMSESDKDILFFDEYSGRYFESTLFNLQNAVYKLNRTFALEGYTNLNEFYRYVDLPETEYGEVLGWSGLKCWEVFNNAWIEIKWEDMELPDGLVAQAIRFTIPPEEGYEEW
jgi:hypothetical protein